MKQEPNSEAAETDQTKEIPAVAPAATCSPSSFPTEEGFYFADNPEGSVYIVELLMMDGELHLLRAGRSRSLAIGEYHGYGFIGPIEMPPRDHFVRTSPGALHRSESQETSKVAQH